MTTAQNEIYKEAGYNTINHLKKKKDKSKYILDQYQAEFNVITFLEFF